MGDKHVHQAYLILGTNMGKRAALLQKANLYIKKLAGEIAHASNIYETAAWGHIEQAAYLNQVLEIQTTLAPKDLLAQLLSIEDKMGRVRTQRYGPRLIDIDILFYKNTIVNEKDISIPHLQIAKRRFVLVPMVELNADFIHPTLKKSMQQLLNECSDPLEVHIYKRETEPK